MLIQIDSKKALKKWDVILEDLGVKDPVKKEWMARYAEGHSILESNSYANLSNTRGMGAIRAAQPGPTPGSYGGSLVGAYNGVDVYTGSGDIAPNMLPTSLKIAAQTIGLDLVTVKTTTSPVFDLVYIDYVYGDGKLNEPGNLSQVFKIKFPDMDDAKEKLNEAVKQAGGKFTVSGVTKPVYLAIAADDSPEFDSGSSSGTTTYPGKSIAYSTFNENVSIGLSPLPNNLRGILEFLGYSRIDGLPMFRAFKQTNAYNQNPFFDEKKNTFVSSETILEGLTSAASSSVAGRVLKIAGTGTSGLVLVNIATKISSSKIVEISLVSAIEDHLEGFSANWKKTSMTRDEAENAYPLMIEPNVFTKKVQVGDISVGAKFKRHQIEDIKASTGYDIIQKTEGVLINELSQKISKEIVNLVYELGEANRQTAPKIKVNIGTGYNTYSMFDFNVDDYLDLRDAPSSSTKITPQGEHMHSLQRKLVSKIKNASNYILVEGRIGGADYLVTNYRLASVLQDIAGYTVSPVPGGASFNKSNKQLYPAGQLDGITIYVDPNARGDQNVIVLGRKNAVDEPGILFVPYLMAQSINIISEATFAPKMIIRSRYSIVKNGFFPEKQFMAIHVTDTNGILI